MQGNPWLATGTAKVILNEINSADPSHLRGYVEVAGDRAQVVIANPAGLYVGNTGFLNAHRATLTTGAPVMQRGNLESYRVHGGTITIDGSGLDTRSANYTDIMARAVQVNAGIWADRLKVSTGVNTISADHSVVTPAAGANDTAPRFSIDVAELGGMYAGHIFLIGTEHGVGMNNAGAIGAGAGEVIVTADGLLQHKNSITVTDGHSFTNRGLINGGDTFIDSPTINNPGTGRLYGDHLAVSGETLNNLPDTIDGVTTAPVIAARTRLDLGVSAIHNSDHALIHSAGDLHTGNALDASHQAIGMGAVINNSSATLAADGDGAINHAIVNNDNAHLETTIGHSTGRRIVQHRLNGSPDRLDNDSVRLINIGNGQIATDWTHMGDEDNFRLMLPSGELVSAWTIYDGIERIARTNVTRSDPALIQTGGHLRFHGQAVHNRNNQIIAGGDNGGDVARLVNDGETGTQTVTTTGSAVHTYIKSHSLKADDRRYDARPYESQSIQTSFVLDITPTGSSGARQDKAISHPLPDNALFTPGNDRYLIATDPRFANYRTWLSSDYMLTRLSRNPDLIMKRLGDGFYEQRLVQQQIQKAIGQRYLAGQSGNEAQYMALMNAGVQQARAFHYTVGVALTDEQMARLTSDIVWLVRQTVTLADGGTQEVLTPQVYLRAGRTQVTGEGTLIAGENVHYQTAGAILNSGAIAAGNTVILAGDDINNLGGRISGADTVLQARTDIDNAGGAIDGGNSVTLLANRDIHINSTRVATANATTTGGNLDSIASVTGGALTMAAGRDIDANAAVIAATGDIDLSAVRDIALSTVHQSSREQIAWNSDNTAEVRRDDAIGSTVQGKAIRLSAGRDLHSRAATVHAEGTLTASAGNDIRIGTDISTASAQDRHRNSGGDILSTTTITTDDSSHRTISHGSTFSGDMVTVQAGHDLHVAGGNVVSDNGTTLAAHNNLNITAAVNTTAESHFREEKTSGLFSGGGIGLTLGSRQQSTDQQNVTGTAAASTIGSIQGDVMLSAGRNYAQTGSDLIAPEGDIAIHAQKIDITEARESSSAQIDSKFKQSGLTVAITSPVISAVQTAQQMVNAAGDTSDPRMKALAAANVALAGKDAIDAIGAGQGSANVTDKLGGVNLAVSIGSSKSQSKTTQTSDSARSSTVAAGGDIHIIVGGAGQDSNLTIQGSTIAAGKQAVLEAENQISLLAAQNTAEQHSTNKSQSGSVGVSLGTDGLLWTASASGARGNADGSDVTWTNTHVNAGDQVTLTSGGDTTLKGAVVTASQITANVGNDLHIESLQDTSRFDSRQQSMGGSISVGQGRMSGNLSGGKSRIDSDYASVIEQSDIRAGDQGFDVTVANDTDLKGGAITSTQAAIDDNRNSFTTGGALSISDIRNQASYNAGGGGVNIGTGTSLDGRLAPQGTSAGVGKDSGNTSSTTRAAISGIAGNKDARTGDAETGIARIFDADRVQKEIDAQVQITQEFGRAASKAIGDHAQSKQKEAAALRLQAQQEPDLTQAARLQSQADQLDADWNDTGKLRLAAHTLIGGLTGGLTGAMGAAAGTLTAATVANLLKRAEFDPTLSATLITLASTAAGGAVGQHTGAASALNETSNNYLLHNRLDDEESELARLERRQTQGQCDTDCEQRIDELHSLDQLRDDQLLPLIEACQRAGRRDCDGRTIAAHYAQANGLSAEAMHWEAHGNPFAFNQCHASDKGGCSYGPLQIAANTGMMGTFLDALSNNPAAKAQEFYRELQAAGGEKAARNDPETFRQTWDRLTATDPQFVQYQIDTLIDRNLYPIIQKQQKASPGFDFKQLSQAQKEALFSAAVQHGSGTRSKTKGAHHVMKRAISMAETDIDPPTHQTYTREDLIYDQVENQMSTAEDNKNKIIAQQKNLITQQKNLITQQKNLITQRENLITQQRDLERRKSALLEQGLGAGSRDIQRIKQQVQALDRQIDQLTRQTKGLTTKADNLTGKVENLTGRVDGLNQEIRKQEQHIQEARQYLKSQAEGSLADGETFLRNFYKARTEMYPREAGRYKKELESLLKQYRAEQKNKDRHN